MTMVTGICGLICTTLTYAFPSLGEQCVVVCCAGSRRQRMNRSSCGGGEPVVLTVQQGVGWYPRRASSASARWAASLSEGHAEPININRFRARPPRRTTGGFRNHGFAACR